MKRTVSLLLLVLLLTSTFVVIFHIRPVGAIITAPSPNNFSPNNNIFLIVYPECVALCGGESQVFRVGSIVVNYPLVNAISYQWYELNASDKSWYPIMGETNSTLNFTAPAEYSEAYVSVGVTYNDGNFYTASVAWIRSPSRSPYFSVEPVPESPLTNANESINGLETPPAQSAIGQNFTVEIHFMNATATNVPAGVAGVEVHFYFANILNYCKPIGFTDELGQPGGALVGPVIYGFAAGFYDDNWVETKTPIAPPYSNSTQYIVAAASLTGPWNGNDGLVAKITFQITGQPSQKNNQTDFYTPLQITFQDTADSNVYDFPSFVVQGTLRIDASPALVGDLNGDGVVNLQDLIRLAQAYNSKPGDPNWNPNADLTPPYGTIGLTELVTLAMHYGQHYP